MRCIECSSQKIIPLESTWIKPIKEMNGKFEKKSIVLMACVDCGTVFMPSSTCDEIEEEAIKWIGSG